MPFDWLISWSCAVRIPLGTRALRIFEETGTLPPESLLREEAMIVVAIQLAQTRSGFLLMAIPLIVDSATPLNALFIPGLPTLDPFCQTELRRR